MVTRLSVVLVEDHQLIREELAILLQDQGWDVAEADSGEQLNELLLTRLFHIAVLDVNLPYEDGFQIAKRLRSSHPSMGLVLLTGRTRPSDRATGYAAGADVYLSKPTNPDELIRAMQNLYGRLQPPDVERLFLHRGGQLLRTHDARSCRVTQQEARLIELLTLQPDQQADAEMLAHAISSNPDEPIARESLSVVISRLRTKTEPLVGEAGLVAAIRGYGYKLLRGVVLE